MSDSYDRMMARATARAHGEDPDKKGGGKAVLATRPPTEPERLLEYISDLTRAIEQAYDIADTMALKDRADAVRWLTRKLDVDREVRNRASESVIRAERRLGEMLLEMNKNAGGNPNWLQGATGRLPTYDDLGIEKTAAARWQMVARLPHEDFEGFIRDTNTQNWELTSGGLLAYARNKLKGKPDATGPTPPDNTLEGESAQVLWDLVGLFNRAGRVLIKMWWRK